MTLTLEFDVLLRLPPTAHNMVKEVVWNNGFAVRYEPENATADREILGSRPMSRVH